MVACGEGGGGGGDKIGLAPPSKKFCAEAFFSLWGRLKAFSLCEQPFSLRGGIFFHVGPLFSLFFLGV